MNEKVNGKKVAILATNGFEESELLLPRRALDEAGCLTQVISNEQGEIKSWRDNNWGQAIAVDLPLTDAKASDFDALLIPGGVMSPDRLRMEPKAIELVRAFYEAGKPIAAICHGPWLLVEADIVEGCEVTSWPSLQSDLRNAGASWVDQEVATDQGLVTSRKPDDIPAFSEKFLEEIAEGVHPRMGSAFLR